MECININCKNDPMKSANPVLWGCDGDFACCQKCYDETRKQMDYFCGTILTDDSKFANWLGVPEKWVKKKSR